MATTAATGWLVTGALMAALVAAASPPGGSPGAPEVPVAVDPRIVADASRVVPVGSVQRVGPARVPPVAGRPSRAFEAPEHDYGPGHRGVDLPAPEGTVVTSPSDGTVTFAGPVAGRGVVVVAHAGGTLTSLEPVDPLAPVGTRVAVGDPVATVAAAPVHAGCEVACVHWGVRIDGRYVDPWWWLGRTGPVRLLPLSDP